MRFGVVGLFCLFVFFSVHRMHCDLTSSLAMESRRGHTLLLSLSNLTRFLSARSSTSLRSFCPADLRSRILSSSRRAVCSHKLVEDALCPVLPMKMLKQYQTIVEYYCQPAGLQAVDCRALSPVIPPGFTAPAAHSTHPVHIAPATAPACRKR